MAVQVGHGLTGAVDSRQWTYVHLSESQLNCPLMHVYLSITVTMLMAGVILLVVGPWPVCGALQTCHCLTGAVGLHLRIFVYPSFNFYDEGSYNQVAGSEILTSLHSGAELPWSHWCY